MARPKKSYTPAPAVPPETMQRLAVIVEVLAGIKTVSEAARSLGLSRNHFQTILHRSVEGLVEAITTKPAGRPARPEAVSRLEAELARLKRENARLQARVGSTDRLLTVASQLLQGRIRTRQTRTRKTKESRHDESNEPEPLAGVEEMRRLGLTLAQASAMAGVHPATVRRWKRREHQPVVRKPLVCIAAEAAGQVRDIVRALNGQVGAESLSHSVAGISRRQAARLKAETLTAMERERKAALTRVRVTVPGVLRGMDGMYLHCADGPLHALICADGAVPYRTGVKTGAHYDAAFVAKVLAADIERNGAPIVYRLDRATAHDAPAPRAVLEAHQVLVLHGPPHCPRYYGQHERQNREHRAWAWLLRQLRYPDIEPRLEDMLASVNGIWRRRTLGWKTAAELWSVRPPLAIDRRALREEVEERTARIARELEGRGKPADLAERLAIEQTLELKGYLQKEVRGWC